ncbi:MAG: hypothetical protein ACI9XK_004284 [Granulosicoccus sp.]|jgi:hypothetical protein
MDFPLTPSQLKVFGELLEFGWLRAPEVGSTIRLTNDRRLMERNRYHYAGGQLATQ